jgi:uncharacterized protein
MPLYARAQEPDGPVTAAALDAGIGVHGRFDQRSLDGDLALIDLNVRSSLHLTKCCCGTWSATAEEGC